MIFHGNTPFELNRDGKKYVADKDGNLDAPKKYQSILKVYGFEPEKSEADKDEPEKGKDPNLEKQDDK